MQQLDPATLKNLLAHNKAPLLIDIREDWEHEAFNIGGLHIPMGDILQRLNEIPKDLPVVLYCEKGIRSTITIQRLEGLGYTQLINLSGGMKAWKAIN
jgi:adenylyltransferase/sulfurtransferase